MIEPFDARYNPTKSGREHTCFGKISAIMERTGVLLTHDEISWICRDLWHCSNADEFYDRMNAMSDQELKEVALKAKFRKVRLTEVESMLYA